MPETPANQHKEEPNYHSTERAVERLATPKELAEFGTIRSDPEIEAKILALLGAELTEEELPEGRPPETQQTEMVIEVREPAIVEVPLETAAANTMETASNPDDFALRVKGIQSTSELSMEADEKRASPGIKGTITGSKPTGNFGTPKKEAEAREYKGSSTDSDFKIDRFGDK